MGEQVQVRKRILMGKRNIYVDLVEPFAYIINGEFMKRVHQTPHDPGGRGNFCPDYTISFCLKFFLSGYK